MASTTVTRLERLEIALGGGTGSGNVCPACASRPRIIGPWTTAVEPDHCPACSAPWTRWEFTLRIGPPLGLTDADER